MIPIDWHDKALELYKQHGRNWSRIADDMTPLFPGLKHFEVKEKIRGYIRSKIESEPAEKKTADLEETILAKLKKGATLEQLSVATALPELAVKGYIQELENKGLEIETNGIDYKIKTQVIENQEPRVKDAGWSGDQIIRFGLMGDTQINSKYTQLTHLHKYYDICESEGISDVYHTGDIDEGEQMRMGHQYECYNQGADDHVNEIVRVYPERKGITTHFITGNHDASIIKRCGYNIGVALANKRKDLDYLGADCAVVKLTPNCTLQLQHNWDGTAYALSYKPQKMIEAMEADSKPNILAIGHYHKAEYLFYRNVHAFQTGCFQGQTPFTRGKGISIHVGGWIITIQVNDKGHIQRIVPEFIPFYSSIPDDYKNWQ